MLRYGCRQTVTESGIVVVAAKEFDVVVIQNKTFPYQSGEGGFEALAPFTQQVIFEKLAIPENRFISGEPRMPMFFSFSSRQFGMLYGDRRHTAEAYVASKS